jgi:hypothetical protein
MPTADQGILQSRKSKKGVKSLIALRQQVHTSGDWSFFQCCFIPSKLSFAAALATGPKPPEAVIEQKSLAVCISGFPHTPSSHVQERAVHAHIDGCMGDTLPFRARGA